MAAKMSVNAATGQGVTRSQMLDDLIMGTNSSSIVSKRSVERLYYPDEPHYFRYFVKKFQRRAPLINRGYWLRLRAIDVIVKRFLTAKSDRKKVVINLGCGSDVLPWQCHVRYGDACQDALFVDIDYPDLMLKKRAIVLETPQLKELLGDDFQVSQSDTNPVLLQSEKYCQLGCDLRELAALRSVLEGLVDLTRCDVLFVAEVSITYMDTESTDKLIEWANSVGQAEFCLLEQLLPHGENHPFAQTMLAHFNKLKTPPRSVKQYPTMQSQQQRFESRGWKGVEIWDLWHAWTGTDFVSSQERIALDDVEPFDEWEEFMLFCRHYFVIHATAAAQESSVAASMAKTRNQTESVDANSQDAVFARTEDARKRRFGHCIQNKASNGDKFAVHMLGLGEMARSDTYDIYTLDNSTAVPSMPVSGPGPRMCSTMTDLGSFGKLLVGGRSSPSNALSDCWVFNEPQNIWHSTWRLPAPLYRHAALRLQGSSLVLVAGGRTGASGISKDYFLFDPTKGWQRCELRGETVPVPTFGGILANSNSTENHGKDRFQGLMAGGIVHDGLIASQQYIWTLDTSDSCPIICFTLITENSQKTDRLCVFGASCVQLDRGTVVCGGTGEANELLGQNINSIVVSNLGYQLTPWNLKNTDNCQAPFMIGASAIVSNEQLLVFGGGATCFSMGTFWETGSFSVDLPDCIRANKTTSNRTIIKTAPIFMESSKVVAIGSKADNNATLQAEEQQPSIVPIPRVKVESSEEFEKVLKNGQPVVIEGLNLGKCVKNWTPEHMVTAVGADKEVVVHECIRDSDKMDFNSKNFRYVTDSFASVMAKMQSGERMYLRSLSQDRPSELPAKLVDDFPGLATEFVLPEQLDHVTRNLFSSILRVSGRANMWLHYDVMANIYAQVSGTKRMILFPPSEVSRLAFAPGASSSSLDVFAALASGRLPAVHPHEAVLRPGDVLLLPSMWLHTSAPLTDMGVAVNVFFRDLKTGYSSGKDVYGNKDLTAYEKGRQDIGRIKKAFQGLPDETRRFYLSRLADELLLETDCS